MPLATKVRNEVDEIPQAEEVLQLGIVHECLVRETKPGDNLDVLPELWWGAIGTGTEAALGQRNELVLCCLGSVQTDCAVRLSRVENVVADSDKRHLLLVEEVVQDLERLVPLLGETGFVHKYDTVDGQRHLDVVALPVDGPREHGVYLVGRGASRALVEVRIKRAEHGGVAKHGHF